MEALANDRASAVKATVKKLRTSQILIMKIEEGWRATVGASADHV